ncbi:Hypothetical protein PAU_01044 [Photorhabdus asymbiotica]|uniref:Uncharacterized protein n=1 Tax=Photorhabdus asymbiotica subsp. asymbiotica (strain ATCC 43949 / 3105-77) TaxID=553480 RepID=B6VK42_PHOAA|nr:Hypothetical protein PAU_01044 [Photorhabdus asymbiotica]CAR66522.1 Hypothetical protein PA-RVA1-4441 [Photorhabdus asymbiotica subsp. asymbiotica ATCC 43949]
MLLGIRSLAASLQLEIYWVYVLVIAGSSLFKVCPTYRLLDHLSFK